MKSSSITTTPVFPRLSKYIKKKKKEENKILNPVNFALLSCAAQFGSAQGASSSDSNKPSSISLDHFWTVNKNSKTHSWCSCACGQASMCYYFNLTLISMNRFPSSGRKAPHQWFLCSWFVCMPLTLAVTAAAKRRTRSPFHSALHK